MKLWDTDRATPETMFCVAFLATIIVAKEPKMQERWQFNGQSREAHVFSKQCTIWRFFKTQKVSPSCLAPTLHWGFQEKREFRLFPISIVYRIIPGKTLCKVRKATTLPGL